MRPDVMAIPNHPAEQLAEIRVVQEIAGEEEQSLRMMRRERIENCWSAHGNLR